MTVFLATSKGYAFCVYQDPAMTDIACAALNGLKMGDKTLTVRHATLGNGQPKPDQESFFAQAQQQIALQKTMPQVGAFGPAEVPTSMLHHHAPVKPQTHSQQNFAFLEFFVFILQNGFESVNFVGNALMDMYLKCGNIELANQLFSKFSQKNQVSWTTMIAGYSMHGLGKEALALFKQMQEADMKPDNITFVAVLSACSRAGLVDEGGQYFESMQQVYGIKPTIEIYGCMVDLLDHVGQLNEACICRQNIGRQ